MTSGRIYNEARGPLPKSRIDEDAPANCTGSGTDGGVAGLGGKGGIPGFAKRNRPRILRRRKVIKEARLHDARLLVLEHDDYNAVKMDCQDGTFKFDEIAPDHVGPLVIESDLTGERFFVCYV